MIYVVHSLVIFSSKAIEDLMKESELMIQFDHLHVMNLIGVCIDLGETPYIIMPYMANGSLLAYLKKERPHLTTTEDMRVERVSLQRKQI